MRISDWSSDVCSSDLDHHDLQVGMLGEHALADQAGQGLLERLRLCGIILGVIVRPADRRHRMAIGAAGVEDRKSVVSGKSVSVRVDLGGRRTLKNKIN